MIVIMSTTAAILFIITTAATAAAFFFYFFVTATTAAKKIALLFTIVSALFLGLSSQFMGFILPLAFVIPIYMGLNGLKARRKSGYLLALGILPLGAAVAVFWIRYFVSLSGNLSKSFTEISQAHSISYGLVATMTYACSALSVVLLCCSVTLFFNLIKLKNIYN